MNNLLLSKNDLNSYETTKAFFNLAPANPTIYNDIEEIYFNNKKDNELIDFYKSQFPAFKDDKKVQGNLNFYLARIYLETDKKAAKDYFIKAKQEFEKVFEKGHAVFNAINEGLEQCE